MRKRSIAGDEKLRILQESDPLRKWQALEDKRFCILCEQTITGRDIRVTVDEHELAHVQCPTPGCTGGPNEWLYPGNPLLSDEAWQDWLRVLEDLSDGSPSILPQPTATPERSSRLARRHQNSFTE